MITEVDVFRRVAAGVVRLAQSVRAAGHPVRWVNLGGGLAIDYTRSGIKLPKPADLVAAIQGVIAGSGLSVMLEPVLCMP